MSKLSHAEQIAKFEAETEILPGKSIATARKIIKELRQFNHYDGAALAEKLLEQAIPRRDYDEVKASRDTWHTAWFDMRDVSGRASWEVPIFFYLNEVPIDPRNFKYMALVDKTLKKFIRVIEMGMNAYNAKKKSDDAFKAHWNFAASAKTMEYYAKRHEAKV